MTLGTYLVLFEIFSWQDSVQIGSLTECVPSVMHDTVVVVLEPQRMYLFRSQPIEIVLLRGNIQELLEYSRGSKSPLKVCINLTSLVSLLNNMGDCIRTYLTNHDVLPIYGDPVVPVWSRVLVPETNNVAQLMHHNAKLVAVLPYRDCLRDEGINSKSTSLSRISQEAIAIAVDFSHLRSVTALPNERAAAARPLREHDPVRVILCPLDKLGNKGFFLPYFEIGLTLFS